MKEFTRVAWASAPAREVWEPRIQAVSKAWLDVELESVARGVRDAALVFGAPAQAWCDKGLVWGEVVPGRYAVGRTGIAVDEMRKAYGKDDETIGRMLGFPACCRAFFHRVWNVEKKRDTTLAMDGYAGRGGATVPCNILGRWLGVRFVPHLPCAWDCTDSAVFSHELEKLWPRQEHAWAEEILCWPVKYSALHGIAVITMPVVKVVTDTDYTAKERVIERPGTVYPSEAPAGLSFPFQKPSFIPLTSLTSFKKSVAVIP